jgi:hypothetical protein
MRIRDSKLGLEIKLGIEINPSWFSLVLDSTILENIPMESNHQLNRNITLSDERQKPASYERCPTRSVRLGWPTGIASRGLRWSEHRFLLLQEILNPLGSASHWWRCTFVHEVSESAVSGPLLLVFPWFKRLAAHVAANGRFFLDLHEIKLANEGIKSNGRMDLGSHEPTKEPQKQGVLNVESNEKLPQMESSSPGHIMENHADKKVRLRKESS